MQINYQKECKLLPKHKQTAYTHYMMDLQLKLWEIFWVSSKELKIVADLHYFLPFFVVILGLERDEKHKGF